MPNFCAFWTTFGPKEWVTRLGVLSDKQKRDFFTGIDALRAPVALGLVRLVLLEAWANGKPNLVYRAGGPAELVRDGIDGLQAACGDVGELAARLGRLVTDPELRSPARRERAGARRARVPLGRQARTGAGHDLRRRPPRGRTGSMSNAVGNASEPRP